MNWPIGAACRACNSPARRWAHFTKNGDVSPIHAICDTRLPGSGTSQAERGSVFDYYGPDFNPMTGQGTCEIWIGLNG